MQGIVFDGQTLALIDDLEVRDPGPGEVEIEIRASGVCHSDLSVVNGTIPYPTPVVLGHEGAGVVRRCGEGVATLAPGDPVALSTLGQCGACPACDSGRPTMCRETFGKRPTPFRARGMPHMLAHGYQVLIQTAAGAGTFPFMTEDSLIGFLDQSSKFLAPVYVGDTLYPALTIDEVTPGRTTGVVGMRTTVHNQNRVLVLEGRQRYLLRRKAATA